MQYGLFPPGTIFVPLDRCGIVKLYLESRLFENSKLKFYTGYVAGLYPFLDNLIPLIPSIRPSEEDIKEYEKKNGECQLKPIVTPVLRISGDVCDLLKNYETAIKLAKHTKVFILLEKSLVSGEGFVEIEPNGKLVVGGLVNPMVAGFVTKHCYVNVGQGEYFVYRSPPECYQSLEELLSYLKMRCELEKDLNPGRKKNLKVIIDVPASIKSNIFAGE